MRTRVLREERGFGLIELLIALTLLNVGILAMVAAFNSGALALQRASKASTGSALADKQMELYRSMLYDNIGLDSTELAADDDNATYSGDSAYSATMVTRTCTGTPKPDECDPSRTVTGPDNRSYRVDTYIVLEAPTASSRNLKNVTIVVRDGSNLSGRALVRSESTFDKCTGVGVGASCA
jgi:type II secretory pathway pseudopilin PulG